MAPRKPKTEADTAEVLIVNHHRNRETGEDYLPGTTKTLPKDEADLLVRGYVAKYVDDAAPDDDGTS